MRQLHVTTQAECKQGCINLRLLKRNHPAWGIAITTLITPPHQSNPVFACCPLLSCISKKKATLLRPGRQQGPRGELLGFKAKTNTAIKDHLTRPRKIPAINELLVMPSRAKAARPALGRITHSNFPNNLAAIRSRPAMYQTQQLQSHGTLHQPCFILHRLVPNIKFDTDEIYDMFRLNSAFSSYEKTCVTQHITPSL